MTEQHDQDEELMRAKLFASMKKKAANAQDVKKTTGQPEVKTNSADKIVIKSFDQIMREKKANDNAGSSDDQGAKEKGLNRKRAVDLKNRQRELVLARKQAKVAASSQVPTGELITTAITRAKRAGQPLGIRARLEKSLAESSPAKTAETMPTKPSETNPTKPASTSPVMASSQAKSPVSQVEPCSKALQAESPLSINDHPAATPSEDSQTISTNAGQLFVQHLEALKREIELANKIIDECAHMNVPEFRDLNMDMVNDDDDKFIQNMSSFLAGTVS